LDFGFREKNMNIGQQILPRVFTIDGAIFLNIYRLVEDKPRSEFLSINQAVLSPSAD